MPAGPGIQQLFGVAAVGQDLGKFFEVLAALRAAGTIFAFAVCAFQAGGDAREFLALLGILGSGDGEREFQQLELARGRRSRLSPSNRVACLA